MSVIKSVIYLIIYFSLYFNLLMKVIGVYHFIDAYIQDDYNIPLQYTIIKEILLQYNLALAQIS